MIVISLYLDEQSALYLNNLQGHTTQQKIEAILEMEADCNLDEVCLMKVIENIAESEQCLLP